MANRPSSFSKELGAIFLQLHTILEGQHLQTQRQAALARQASARVRLQAATRGLTRRRVQAMREEQERATAQQLAVVRLQAAACGLLAQRQLREMQKKELHQMAVTVSASSAPTQPSASTSAWVLAGDGGHHRRHSHSH